MGPTAPPGPSPPVGRDWPGQGPFPRLTLLVTRLRSASSVLLLALVVAVLGAGLSACSSSQTSGNALVVNGDALSNRDFQDRLDAIMSDQAYVSKAMAGANGTTAVTSDNPNSYSTDFTTQVLNQQVSFDLAAQEVANRNLTVTDQDRTQAEQLLANDLSTSTTANSSGQVQDDGSGQKALDDLGAFKPVLIAGVANILAIQNDYTTQLSTDDALRKTFQEQADQFKNEACVSALLIVAGNGPTQDPTTGAVVPPPASDYPAALTKAQDLRAQLVAGGDLATLAGQADNAKTRFADGNLGCSPIGTYAQSVPELDAAITNQTVGEIGQPVKTDYGYFVVVVRNRGDLTFDDAKAQLQQGVQTQVKQVFQKWLNDAAIAADVTVDPQWGSWDSTNGTVVAPSAATSSSTTSTVADAGVGQDLLGQRSGDSSTTTSTP